MHGVCFDFPHQDAKRRHVKTDGFKTQQSPFHSRRAAARKRIQQHIAFFQANNINQRPRHLRVKFSFVGIKPVRHVLIHRAGDIKPRQLMISRRFLRRLANIGGA